MYQLGGRRILLLLLGCSILAKEKIKPRSFFFSFFPEENSVLMHSPCDGSLRCLNESGLVCMCLLSCDFLSAPRLVRLSCLARHFDRDVYDEAGRSSSKVARRKGAG